MSGRESNATIATVLLDGDEQSIRRAHRGVHRETITRHPALSCCEACVGKHVKNDDCVGGWVGGCVEVTQLVRVFSESVLYSFGYLLNATRVVTSFEFI